MPPDPPRRDLSVDLARGLACVLMIQTHAFHGWVRPDLHGDVWFRATRWLGAFPLPGFLLLAGVSVALQLGAAGSKGVSGIVVARAVARRGALLVLGGYATSFVWGSLDGARSLQSFLRVDVLHVIGVSLVLAATVVAMTRSRGPDELWSVMRWTAGVALAIVIVCPWVTRVTRSMQGPWRYVLGLLAEVEGVSAMPAIPLAAWCMLGVSLGLWQTLGAATSQEQRRRDRSLLTLVGLVALVLGAWVTQALVSDGSSLSRASVTVWPNALEGAGRGVVLLAVGGWLSAALDGEGLVRARLRETLVHFGRASLWVYVLHVPFCYGRLAFGLRRGLSLWSALPCVILLMLACYVVARALALRKARSRGAAALRSSF